MGSEHKRSGFFGGFVFGGIVGLVTALFISKDKLGNVLEKAKEGVKEAIEEGKEAAARRESEVRDGPDKED